jgi:hypothetical protein
MVSCGRDHLTSDCQILSCIAQSIIRFQTNILPRYTGPIVIPEGDVTLKPLLIETLAARLVVCFLFRSKSLKEKSR